MWLDRCWAPAAARQRAASERLRFLALTRALKPREGVERSEEIARDGGVVAKVHLPVLGRHGHEADGDGVVRVQMFGAVLDELARAIALSGGGDVEDAGLDATRAEAAPVRLSQAQDERVFGGIVRLEGLAKAAEDFFVLVLVFLGEDDESGGSEAVLETVQAAALFAGFGLGSTFAAVATIGLALSF